MLGNVGAVNKWGNAPANLFRNRNISSVVRTVEIYVSRHVRAPVPLSTRLCKNSNFSTKKNFQTNPSSGTTCSWNRRATLSS